MPRHWKVRVGQGASALSHSRAPSSSLGAVDSVVAVGGGGGSGGGLTGTPGDREISLSWASTGANSYKVQRWDPSREVSPTWITIATGLMGTTYLDSPDYFAHSNTNADWVGRGLIDGLPYQHRVIPVLSGVDQAPIGPVTTRPSDGYTVPNWTTVRGSNRRDARNTGHWDLISATPDVRSGDDFISPGTYSDIIWTGTCRLSSVGTYTFNRCWIQALYNQAGEPSVSTLVLNDCTIGPPTWQGSTNTIYDKNGLLGGNGGKVTLSRCMVLHGGSQIFIHIASPNIIEDSFFTFATGYEGQFDPHIDGVWVQGTVQSPAPIIRRNRMEMCPTGMSSIIGPGSSNCVITDNLFDGLSAQGGVQIDTSQVVTGNRYKRYRKVGGGSPVTPRGYNANVDGDGNAFSGTTPGTYSDNRWADDNSLL